MTIEFKDRLKKILDDRNLRATDLSRLTGIQKSSISDWLNGKYEAKLDKIERIAKALSVSPSYLAGWEDEQSSKENK